RLGDADDVDAHARSDGVGRRWNVSADVAGDDDRHDAALELADAGAVPARRGLKRGKAAGAGGGLRRSRIFRGVDGVRRGGVLAGIGCFGCGDEISRVEPYDARSGRRGAYRRRAVSMVALEASLPGALPVASDVSGA